MTSAAATLGQRLLDEIKEESLDEVFSCPPSKYVYKD
jgi:hypothetical protein